jgi:hypothetical protein
VVVVLVVQITKSALLELAVEVRVLWAGAATLAPQILAAVVAVAVVTKEPHLLAALVVRVLSLCVT